jgi:hypothetical protein
VSRTLFAYGAGRNERCCKVTPFRNFGFRSIGPERLCGLIVFERVAKTGDHQMRDIRGDLQDRANLLAEQISTAQGHFERYLDQLKREHETRVKDLKFALDSVHMVIGIEGRRLQSSFGPVGQVDPGSAGATVTTARN